jgi:hypothetical protein
MAAAVAVLAFLSPARPAQAYEGYGYQSVGGQAGPTIHVTNTGGGTSTGSFRWALGQPSPKTIVFDVGGTIQLVDTARISGASSSFVTIDGTTAPSPGITIRPSDGGQSDSLYIENGAHDIIVKGLRFIGFDADGNGGDLISLFGSPNPVFNVVIDHCTFENGDDGAIDITNVVNDSTISWNFFHNNHKSQLVKYGPRNRLSFHHNVYADSVIKGERNPLLWGDTDNVDFVNNINYGWQFRGLEIRHEGDGGSPGKRVNANVVNNLFTHSQWNTINDGLVYGSGAGPDTEDGGPGGTPAQGTLITTSNMGKLWVSGNILPPNNRDQYSTIAAPLVVPAPAQVTTWTAAEVRLNVLPTVGTVFRNAAEQALLDVVAAAQPNVSAISADDLQVTEGNAGTVTAAFTVRLSPPSTQQVTVQFATAAGTATAGTDYTSASGTVTFPAGTPTRTVNVSVIGDVLDEPNETFNLNLSSASSGATIVDSQAVATIVDDDATPSLSVNDGIVLEGDAGTTNTVFTVSMANLSAQAVTVSFATADNTAIGGVDYQPRSGVLTFPAGTATPQTVTVPAIGDTLDEPIERFDLALQAPTNAVLFKAEGTGTILDDDGGPFQVIELPHGADVRADLQAQGPIPDRDLYVVSLGPYTSYEVLIDEASGSLGTGSGPRLERVAASDLSTVLASSQPVGTGPARSLRIRNATSVTVDAFMSVRSNSCGTDCGPEDVYRIQSRETTASLPRFNQSGTQNTILIVQNRSDHTVNGSANYWSPVGVRLVSQPFTLLARRTFVLIGNTLPQLTGQSGAITIDHDGRYGDLEGKAVSVEVSTGFGFDTPLQYRRP